MRRFESLEEFGALIGQTVASSDWITVTQERIDEFARATGDHQWIHVDPVRAAAGPFGATIAHGFLTLSMLPHLMERSMVIEDVRMGINYGVNRVRFPSPVPSGSRVHARFRLLSFEPIEGGAQIVIEATFLRDGHSKPVCVVEQVVRQYT